MRWQGQLAGDACTCWAAGAHPVAAAAGWGEEGGVDGGPDAHDVEQAEEDGVDDHPVVAAQAHQLLQEHGVPERRLVGGPQEGVGRQPCPAGCKQRVAPPKAGVKARRRRLLGTRATGSRATARRRRSGTWGQSGGCDGVQPGWQHRPGRSLPWPPGCSVRRANCKAWCRRVAAA